jgi:tRNA (guanine10-N2)-dimethyltransferase
VSLLLVEISGEAPELARLEVLAAAQALGGRGAGAEPPTGDLVPVDVPGADAGFRLADRLALARRCLEDRGPVESLRPEREGETAAFRRRGHPTSGGTDAAVHAAARAWVAAGGRVDLVHPTRRFWVGVEGAAPDRAFEEVGTVDRPSVGRRRISALPFQRPVGLAPRLARAAANLAGARPGTRIADPFLGTGALLAEAALLGARVTGVDRDPEMVRGALRNFAFVGAEAEELRVGDSGDVAALEGSFDAVLTDLPYGRASGTGGEEPTALAARVLTQWADRVTEGGRVVVVGPGGPDPLAAPWVRGSAVALRVHRSLTREFRVYERAGATG